MLEGAFIPAAAKSNALITGAPGSTKGFVTAASRAGGIEVPFANMPDDFGLLLLPNVGGLGPKVNEGLGFGLAGSNPKENGVADLEGPGKSSKLGSDETGSSLTRLCILLEFAELGKMEVALEVMTKVGRELAVNMQAFALMASSLVSLTCTFVCSCDFVEPPGERSVGLKVKPKLEEGGSNLNSDF